MRLDHLKIENFRNIQSASLNFSPGLNFIYGQNGSGKTSVLEALSCLSTGRSFRTRKHGSVINFEANAYVLFSKGKFGVQGLSDVTDEEISFGLQRFKNGKCNIKANGQAVRSAAELARLSPLLVINATSFDILEGTAKDRRQFFDWLVFHVKHQFREAWIEYSKAIKQRNSLLRKDKVDQSQINFWDKELCRFAEVIGGSRKNVFQPFLTKLKQYLKLCSIEGFDSIEIEYQQGWPIELSFIDSLSDSYNRDLMVGYTTTGPHKSDLKFLINKRDAVEILSRGQQKTFIVALYMSALACFIESNNKNCLLLIDDLPSELDKDKCKLISDWVCELQLQSFVTGIELKKLIETWPTNNKYPPKVFHVKHGVIKEIEREWSEIKND